MGIFTSPEVTANQQLIQSVVEHVVDQPTTAYLKIQGDLGTGKTEVGEEIAQQLSRKGHNVLLFSEDSLNRKNLENTLRQWVVTSRASQAMNQVMRWDQLHLPVDTSTRMAAQDDWLYQVRKKKTVLVLDDPTRLDDATFQRFKPLIKHLVAVGVAPTIILSLTSSDTTSSNYSFRERDFSTLALADIYATKGIPKRIEQVFDRILGEPIVNGSASSRFDNLQQAIPRLNTSFTMYEPSIALDGSPEGRAIFPFLRREYLVKLNPEDTARFLLDSTFLKYLASRGIRHI